MSPDSWSGSLKFRLWLGEAVSNVDMIYELRHYIPVPGKEAAILNRFKNHTFGIFKKNGFKTLNFWIDAKGSGQLWYVFRMGIHFLDGIELGHLPQGSGMDRG